MTDPTSPPDLILASASPRRKRLLTAAGYACTVIEPPIDEPDTMGPTVPPVQQAEALSYFKARSVATKLESGIVIAADTIVACQDTVFGKPHDLADARHILSSLLGRSQEVITGITLLDASDGHRLIEHDITVVYMREIPDEALDAYLATGAWRGKAGAYGIQDRGDAFVERIDGSFTNVVGLPMERLTSMLEQWGYTKPIHVADGE
ncbi:MAG: septum formation protein Maf [bacterium]|nr:septum formation protein Maf [bacterium]